MEDVLRAKMNEEGRLVIPAGYRKQLGLKPGQDLMLRMTHDGLLITTYAQALRRFQDEVASLVPPGTSMVDEFLAERRAEAAREGG
jgi:AbrB family looped-hinge helix DNA binding protein